MSTNVTEKLLSTVKTSCDNDVLMYVFNGEDVARAYDRKYLDTLWTTPYATDENGNILYDAKGNKMYKLSYKYIPITVSGSSNIDVHTAVVYTASANITVQNVLKTISTESIPNATFKYFSLDGINEVSSSELARILTSGESITVCKVYSLTVTSTVTSGFKIIPTNAELGSISDNGFVYTSGEDEYTYRIQCIMLKLSRNPCVNIFYKNKNGVWIDFRKCTAVHPKITPVEAAITYQSALAIDINILPKCIFTDAEGYVHRIDEHDGQDNNLAVSGIEIDTNDPSIVKCQPYTSTASNVGLTHLMDDLKVTMPSDYSGKDFLVWLNGAFVPRSVDSTYKNIFYLENAMYSIGTKVVNQKIGAPKTYTGSGATVELDESYDEYRYDINLRLFGWQGVAVSDWYKPASTTTVPITHNYSLVYITKTVTFPVEINPNAHMLMCNGVVMDESEYTVDVTTSTVHTSQTYTATADITLDKILGSLTPAAIERGTFQYYSLDGTNKISNTTLYDTTVKSGASIVIYSVYLQTSRKTITLKNVVTEAYDLLNSIIADMNYDAKNGTSYYTNVKPLNLITEAITQKSYSLINFSSKDASKELYLKHSTACAVNFPYMREVTFPVINIGDIVLIDGVYSRYEWIHQNTIRLPRFQMSYFGDEADFKESDVQRLYFVLKDK